MVKETALYDLLAVKPDASDIDIKKAFRKQAVKYHPDRNTDVNAKEMFQRINMAYETLTDPSKRRLYDQLGEEGLKQQTNGASSQSPVTADIRERVVCSLAELYNGAKVPASYKRQILCPTCTGSGQKKDCTTVAPTSCSSCKGQGVQVIVQRTPMGMMQQQRACPDCMATGKCIPDKDRCTGPCQGKGVFAHIENVMVDVPAGSLPGQFAIQQEMSHQVPDKETGNAIFIFILDANRRSAQDARASSFEWVHQTPHLLHKCRLSVSDALFGCTLTLRHLDGTVFCVRTQPGWLDGKTLVVAGKGMRSGGMRGGGGDLHIVADIQVPTNEALQHLNKTVGDAFRLAVPSLQTATQDESVESCHARPIVEEEQQEPSSGQPSQVQCAQQ